MGKKRMMDGEGLSRKWDKIDLRTGDDFCQLRLGRASSDFWFIGSLWDNPLGFDTTFVQGRRNCLVDPVYSTGADLGTPDIPKGPDFYRKAAKDAKKSRIFGIGHRSLSISVNRRCGFQPHRVHSPTLIMIAVRLKTAPTIWVCPTLRRINNADLPRALCEISALSAVRLFIHIQRGSRPPRRRPRPR